MELINLEQREIIIVRYPFTDPRDYKIRPALIISNSNFNKRFDPLICPITTKKNFGNFLINNDLEKGNLEKTSFVNTKVISTIHPELILKSIGKLKPSIFEEIKTNLIKNL